MKGTPSIVTLEDAAENIGRGVTYQSYPEGPIEQGTITSVNEIYVFVRFTGDMAAKATRPANLRWMHE